MTERIKIREVHSSMPYATTEYSVSMSPNLTRADRTLTHVQRYLAKEKGKGRVPNLEDITSRSKIGIKRIAEPV